MSLTFQVTEKQNGTGFYEFNEIHTLRALKKSVIEKMNSIEPELYVIDEYNQLIMIESEADFRNLLKNSEKVVRILATENIEGCDATVPTKKDLRNIKLNSEFTDMKNNKKSYNKLEQIKREKSKMNKEIHKIKSHVNKSKEMKNELESLQKQVEDMKKESKQRLIQKYWKTARRCQVTAL